jgi:hypothetical protein
MEDPGANERAPHACLPAHGAQIDPFGTATMANSVHRVPQFTGGCGWTRCGSSPPGGAITAVAIPPVMRIPSW